MGIATPLNDWIIVRENKQKTMSSKGSHAIHLPDSHRSALVRGKIVAVGKGRVLYDGSRMNPDVTEGDEVLYPSVDSVEIFVGDERLYVVKESDLIVAFNQQDVSD